MKSIERQGENLVYLMVYPDDYDPEREYPLIFLLHGFGASMRDLAGLTPAMDQHGYIYACPNAPLEVEIGPGPPGFPMIGYSWTPPRGAGTPEDIVRIEETLERFFDEVMAEHRVPPGRALLMGFSQGASMTYRCGLRRPDLFAGIIALSGGLPEDVKTRLPAQRDMPIFIGHGVHDNPTRAQQARAFLEDEGYKPLYEEYPMAHEITQQVLNDLVPWIHQALPPLQQGE